MTRVAIVLVLGVAACEGTGRDEPTSATTPATSGGAGSDTAAGTAADGDDAMSTADGSAGVTSEPPAPDFPCASVDECFLHGDCCSCVALHRDEPVPEDCPADCDRDACDVWGLSEVLCSHSCLIRLVECDPAMVTCAEPPPDCAEGEVPSLDERCWSGHCVPQDFCRPY